MDGYAAAVVAAILILGMSASPACADVNTPTLREHAWPASQKVVESRLVNCVAGNGRKLISLSDMLQRKSTVFL